MIFQIHICELSLFRLLKGLSFSSFFFLSHSFWGIFHNRHFHHATKLLRSARTFVRCFETLLRRPYWVDHLDSVPFLYIYRYIYKLKSLYIKTNKNITPSRVAPIWAFLCLAVIRTFCFPTSKKRRGKLSVWCARVCLLRVCKFYQKQEYETVQTVLDSKNGSPSILTLAQDI